MNYEHLEVVLWHLRRGYDGTFDEYRFITPDMIDIPVKFPLDNIEVSTAGSC
jgi:hypothetical protein